MFSGSTVLPDNKETELGSSDREAFPSTGKNTRIALVSCCTSVSLLKSLGVFCFNRLVLSEVHKKYFKDLVSHELAACFFCFLPICDSIFNYF